MTLTGPIRFASRILSSDRGRSRSPYKLNFMATARCNQECLHCGIWKEEREELTLHEIREFFRKSNRFSWVDVSGGEIVLRPDIPDIFAAALEECRDLYLLHFATNGSEPEKTELLAREILSMRPPRFIVTVSVDGPAGVHDRMRGMEGAYDRALETYRRLSDLPGCRTYLGMTLTAENTGLYEKTLSGVRAEIPQVTPGDLHVNLLHRSPHYYGEADVTAAGGEDLTEEIDSILARRPGNTSPVNFLERRYLTHARKYVETGTSPLPCRALVDTCFIRADGTVYPCISWDRPLGNLRNHGYDLSSILEGAESTDTLAGIAEKACPGCWTPCEAVPAILESLFTLPTIRRAAEPERAIPEPNLSATRDR